MTVAQSVNVHGQPNVGQLFPSFSFSERFLIMTVTFTKDKETKNTVRFTAARGSDISGSLYVAKDSEIASQDELVLEISENAQVTA